MKKIIFIMVLLFSLIIAGVTGYFLYVEKMLIRLPVLVQKDAKITFVIGGVTYRETKESSWQQAIVGFVLKKGYEIKTDKNSIADLRFNDGFAIRISENSIFKIDHLTVRKVLLNVEKGAVYGKFEKLNKENEINIKTPTAFAGIRGTELGFEVGSKPKDKRLLKVKNPAAQEEEDTQTTIYSLSGITEIYNPKFGDQKILLSFQNKLLVAENNPPAKPEKLTEDEITKVRTILNSIHTEEVLLISTKISFKLGSAKLLTSSYPELDKIVEVLKEKRVRVRIEGHTDSIANDTINQALSVERAKSIKDYLIGKQLDPDRFEIAGYGSSKPIASNKTEDGRSQNRRVEFIIIE
ncbi:MAG: OmpA family protein [Spirochaetes bacterium]|nr:OmpA family protein [Spirochaetota bacterium]